MLLPAEMRWNVAPPAPMSVLATLSAVPDVVESIVLPAPETTSVPLVVAVIPAPVVVSMSRPPPESVSVWPSLPVNETAAEPTLLMTFDALLKVVEPPVLPVRLMPPPASFVSVMAPESVDRAAGAVCDLDGLRRRRCRSCRGS